MATARFLTVAEVAKRLGISARRVNQLCQTGQLPSIKVNDRLRLIDPATLAKFRRQPPGRPKQQD